jgi:Spy/CpxP family protein refolding chaperone
MAGTANEQQCGALHTQVQQKQAEVATFRFQRMLEMRRVLTPDQRQRLVTLLEEQRFGGGGHGGGWHDRDDE